MVEPGQILRAGGGAGVTEYDHTPPVAGSRLDMPGLERDERPVEAGEPGLVVGRDDDLGAGAAKVTSRTAGRASSV